MADQVSKFIFPVKSGDKIELKEFGIRDADIASEASTRANADNTLQGNINSEAATRASADSNLQSQINQIIAPSGEAPSAAEVQNARIGSDGTVYPNLGDAIRTQNSNLKNVVGSGFTFKLIPYNTDLDTLTNSNGFYFCDSGGSYSHFPYPSNYSAYLICGVSSYGNAFQIIMPYFYGSTAASLNEQVLRRNFNRTAWSEWKPFEYKNNNLFSQTISAVTTDPFVGQTTVDLNTVLGNHFYLLSDSHTYANIPNGFTIGFLETVLTTNWSIQFLWQFNGAKMWKRRGNGTGTTWENWRLISGDGGVTNNYNFVTNENSYTVNATPTITTDTNNYLASTNDTTDRTTDIIALLASVGTCHLGPGEFYVSNLVMPNDSAIIGSGPATKVIMSGTASGCAIQMQDRCKVSDLQLLGNVAGISVSAVGGRHGILWAGTYTEDETSANQPKQGIVNNVWIRHFSGGGITCYNTGYGISNALEVVNAYIENCGAGLNISYFSEFHKFTNVRCPGCYYGCINNGGNNIFVNCDFSICKVGMLMDNSSDQSPNNSHGSAIGCVFNHSDNNTGIGINILNCKNGFIFEGCQIFFSQINIENSDGVVVSNCNFGANNCDITISGGGAMLFANNMHQSVPTITITNNSNVHFVNCYVRATGASVTPS